MDISTLYPLNISFKETIMINIERLSNMVKNILISHLFKDFLISYDNDNETILVDIFKKDVIVSISFVNNEYQVLLSNCIISTECNYFLDNQSVVRLANEISNVILKFIK